MNLNRIEGTGQFSLIPFYFQNTHPQIYRRDKWEVNLIYAVATNIRVQSDPGLSSRIQKAITVVLNE